MKKLSGIRLSDKAIQLKKLLSKELGIKENAVVELAIRDLAEKYKIKLPGDANPNNALFIQLPLIA